MSIYFDMTGVTEVTTMLQGVEDRMIDETPAMDAIVVTMQRSSDLNFVEQGRPSWAPLAESTIRARRGHGGNVQILRDTGLLMQSVGPTGGNEYSIREVTPESARIGTNRPGAAAHQDGLGNMPERRFLMHQTEDIADYKIIIRDHIIHGLGTGEPKAA